MSAAEPSCTGLDRTGPRLLKRIAFAHIFQNFTFLVELSVVLLEPVLMKLSLVLKCCRQTAVPPSVLQVLKHGKPSAMHTAVITHWICYPLLN